MKEIKEKDVMKLISGETPRDEVGICSPIQVSTTAPSAADSESPPDSIRNADSALEDKDDQEQAGVAGETGEQAEEPSEPRLRRNRTAPKRLDPPPPKPGRKAAKPNLTESDAQGRGQKRGPRGRDDQGNPIKMKYNKDAVAAPTGTIRKSASSHAGMCMGTVSTFEISNDFEFRCRLKVGVPMCVNYSFVLCRRR